MHLRDHIFSIVLASSILISIGISFHRFLVAHEYVVSYRVSCDPYTDSCFAECTDDACTEVHYHLKVEREAEALLAACGSSVIGCAIADRCLPEERYCSIRRCDPQTDGSECETITRDSQPGDAVDDARTDTL